MTSSSDHSAISTLSVEIPGGEMCFSCNKPIKRQSTSCSVCSATYHPSCANLYPILSNGGIKKCCGPPSPLPPDDLRSFIREEFATVNNSIKSVKSDIKDLNTALSNISIDVKSLNERIVNCETEVKDSKKRVNDLEEKFEEFNKGNSASGFDFDSCLSEWEDRQRRKNNLLIFGLQENKSINQNENHNADLTSIISLLHLIYPNDVANIIKIWRIGIPSEVRLKPRPLKVILPDKVCAFQIRQKFVEYKRSKKLPNEFQPLTVAFDRTRYQQTEFQRVNQELKNRLEKGEKDLTIRFQLGAPSIVKKKHQVP